MKTKKVQKVSLIFFLSCMIVCAGLVIFMVWNKPQDLGVINQITLTSFVVGLASFLTWVTTIVIDIKKGIEKK
ncbi:MAG: hypothetical protein EOM85_01035 [Candidatus Moranbacteria bacterium]|nr:hypothetical protein [Candidatus Moranbacteria bacterium]